MFSHQPSQVKPSLIVVVILLISSPICRQATASGAEDQVCDVNADYSLGVENYGEAIRLHREILRKNPGNALARYHLGFAEGMIGNRATEIDEYRRAEVLGLRIWDLFLNLGLAELERGDLYAATDSLQMAVLLGEEHPEAHFNLALAEERRGMLVDAEQETRASLRLSPGQADARNLLGVIYAREGKTVRAAQPGMTSSERFRRISQRAQIWRYWTAKARLSLARRRPLPSPPQRPPSKPSTMRADHACRHPKYS